MNISDDNIPLSIPDLDSTSVGGSVGKEERLRRYFAFVKYVATRLIEKYFRDYKIAIYKEKTNTLEAEIKRLKQDLETQNKYLKELHAVISSNHTHQELVEKTIDSKVSKSMAAADLLTTFDKRLEILEDIQRTYIDDFEKDYIKIKRLLRLHKTLDKRMKSRVTHEDITDLFED